MHPIAAWRIRTDVEDPHTPVQVDLVAWRDPHLATGSSGELHYGGLDPLFDTSNWIRLLLLTLHLSSLLIPLLSFSEGSRFIPRSSGSLHLCSCVRHDGARSGSERAHWWAQEWAHWWSQEWARSPLGLFFLFFYQLTEMGILRSSPPVID